MKKTKEIISILQLQQSLQYWEKINRVGDMIFHVCKKIWPTHPHLDNRDSQKMFKTLIGSELTSVYRLGRSIQNYLSLRRLLESNEDFNPSQFLPRIPKNLRDKFSDQVEYLEACYGQSSNASIMLIPVFIQRWLSGKKVCEVSNPRQIKLVDPCEKSYLSYLPYDSFILKLDNPLNRFIVIGENFDSKHYCHYSQFLIHRQGDILKILGIPSDVEHFHFNAAQEQALIDVMSLSKNSSDNKIDNTLHAYSAKCENLLTLVDDFIFEKIDVNTGNIVVHDPEYVIREFDPLAAIEKHLYKARHKTSDEVLEQIAAEWAPGTILFLLNGLGKLFFEYEAPREIALYDLSETCQTDDPKDDTPATVLLENEAIIPEREKQKWYEVSPGNITFVTLPKRRLKGVGVKINTGREMPPHLRRGHYRHYRDENDVVIKKVFVRQATIRKDKLKNGEAIHGSLSEYK